MKILWLCNIVFTNNEVNATGTWLVAMYRQLLNTDEVSIVNITSGNVFVPTRCDFGNSEQWIIPQKKIKANGLPHPDVIAFIQSTENRINPDLIHIWGTEDFWGSLKVHNLLRSQVLLDIQGLLSPCAEVFYGGLSFSERLKCIGLKEFLLPKRMLYFKRLGFIRKGKFESNIIKSINNIAVQSEWVKQYIEFVNPKAKIFNTGIILRSEFYESKKWNFNHKKKLEIFTTSSGSNTYKGLHILFKAVAILKIKYPNVQLKIGGRIIYEKKLQDGYNYFLLRQIKLLGIEKNVQWLGPLNALQIIDELLDSSVFVIPSFVETYCVALAESLLLGVPTVISYAAAMTELANDDVSALFFPVGDFRTCARKIEFFFNNAVLSNIFSKNAIREAEERNDANRIVNNQLIIYKKIIGI